MEQMTLPESSFFLLLLCANIDSELNGGELTDAEEDLILSCTRNWGFYESFYTQEEIEAAIRKYNNILSGSIRTENESDFIEQCAELLKHESAVRDMTFYLCLEILFLNGRVEKGSREDLIIDELQHQLNMDPNVATFIFGLEIFKAILSS